MRSVNKQIEDYANKILENETKAMKDSLMLYGFEEDPALTRKDEGNNCESLVKEFLGKDLIDENEDREIEIDNKYRVGKDTARKNQDQFR